MYYDYYMYISKHVFSFSIPIGKKTKTLVPQYYLMYFLYKDTWLGWKIDVEVLELC